MNEPRPGVRPLDGLLALGTAMAGWAEIWVPLGSREGSGSQVMCSVAVAAVAAALLVRRRHPLVPIATMAAAWAVVGVTSSAYLLFYGQLVPLLLSTYAVSRHARGPRLRAGTLLVVGSLVTADLTQPLLRSPGELVFHWAMVSAAWCTGFWLARFEQRAHEHQQRAVEAEVGAATAAMTAVLDERTRIARELHDIVAHSVSSIVVQAGAAEQVAHDDPEAARRALASIRESGSSALAEMRRLVTMLRSDDDVAALIPQPGIAALPELVDAARLSGLPVTLTVSGAPRELPAGLDLTAYRIVQEALTNVRRHAGASRADVTVSYAADSLRVEVRDDGRGPSRTSSVGEGGHGLIGIRERAALYGGRVEIGALDGTGWTVRADLPVAS